MGLADDEGNAEGFQVHGNQGGSRQVGTHGHHSPVKILDAELPEHVQVTGVGGNGLRHPVGDFVDDVLIRIDGQDIFAAVVELQRHFGAETPEADHHIAFHGFSPSCISRSADRYWHI